jgi:hypothetical protein
MSDETKTQAEDKPESHTEAAPPAAIMAATKDDGLVENKYDVEVKLSDLQNSEESPLYSAKTFAELGL